jgi:hypothetical protein
MSMSSAGGQKKGQSFAGCPFHFCANMQLIKQQAGDSGCKRRISRSRQWRGTEKNFNRTYLINGFVAGKPQNR